MGISMRDVLRFFYGGDKKERSIFKNEQEAYDFCRRTYKETGGVTPELRRNYEFYMKNYNNECGTFDGPGKHQHSTD